MSPEREAALPRWVTALLSFGRSHSLLAVLVSVFWSVAGATLMLLFARAVLVAQINATAASVVEERSERMAADAKIQAEVDTARSVLASILANQDVNRRAICIDHTQYEQSLIGLTCPANLHKAGS